MYVCYFFMMYIHIYVYAYVQFVVNTLLTGIGSTWQTHNLGGSVGSNELPSQIICPLYFTKTSTFYNKDLLLVYLITKGPL